MSNLQKLLAELSEIAPQICKQIGVNRNIYQFSYDDGFIDFYIRDNGQLEASYKFGWTVIGTPALDWLQGALMRVIEGKGWGYETTYWHIDGIAHHRVYFFHMRVNVIKDTHIEALLTAFIQALKGEQWNKQL